jgi:PAS domain S-box-containing protein
LPGSDSSARQHAEETLLKAGTLQNAILNSANFSSIATDEKGVIQLFNVGAERMLGYAACEVVDKVTPADISDPQEVIARAQALSLELATPITPGFEALVFKASRGIEDIYELTYIRKNGSRFPAVVSVTALRDDQGGIIGYLLIGTDNTARKQAEEALLKAGALQNAIFNSANFSSIATDEKGVIQLFNVGAERMLGYAAAEVVDKVTPADISDPQEVIARAQALSLELATHITPGFEALVFKASRGIEDIYELTYIRKNGSRFPAVVSVTALRDAEDAIIGYLLIGTDNTARKQIEAQRKYLDQRLRDQQFYTRSLVESNINAMVAIDTAGIITDVNKQMEILTGCTRDELIGAPFKGSFTDPERAETCIRRALSGGKVVDYELTARARDGKETVVSYNATTFHDRDRTLQGVFAAARDVTERQRFERTLQENNVELERARTMAEEANRAKSDFLSSMGHEMHSPMAAILGFAQMLPLPLNTAADRRLLSCGQIIRRNAASLLSLIDQILDLSQIEAGQMKVERISCHLPELLAEIVSSIRVKALAKGLAFEISFQGSIPQTIQSDPRRLRQILVNLLGDAIKFAEAGTIHARVKDEGAGGRNIVLRVDVTNSGAGVLKPFSQGAESLTRKLEATGLGLTISRQFARLLGGDVTVILEGHIVSAFALKIDGGSSTGVKRLQSLTEAALPALLENTAAPISHIDGRILVVEAEHENDMLLKLQLEQAGAAVVNAVNGQIAVDLATTQTFDLILLDMRMSVNEDRRVTVMDQLRRRGVTAPIIALTSYGKGNDEDISPASGCSGSLSEPTDWETVLKTVNQVLQKRGPNSLPPGSRLL